MLFTAVIITAVLFYAMYETSSINKETHGITGDLITSRKSAFELQVASDYLTEQIRSFVITGEKEYLDNYFEEANVTKRRENALSELELRHGSSNAFKNLSDAMEESMELMESECYAARLAVDAYGYDLADFPPEIQSVKLEEWTDTLTPDEKKSEAEKLLFGSEYQRRKDAISSYMQNCLEELDAEIEIEQTEATSRLDQQLLIEHILTVLLIVVLLGSILIPLLFFILPLQKRTKNANR